MAKQRQFSNKAAWQDLNVKLYRMNEINVLIQEKGCSDGLANGKVHQWFE
jgi:hypothetical protein